MKRILSLFAIIFIVSSCSSRSCQIEPEAPIMEVPVVIEKPTPSPCIPRKKIVIDPGHGGDDFGTQTLIKPTYKEKNLNLATAKMLQDYLRQLGYEVLMTRNKDFFISLEKRSQFANAQKSDLFVSVHYNSAPSSKAEGIEIFYYWGDKNKERVQASKNLAETVLKHIIGTTKAKSRGIKNGNLAVLRKTTMPAILIEGGFLTNEEELTKLKNSAYLKAIAWGAAQGIHAYLSP